MVFGLLIVVSQLKYIFGVLVYGYMFYEFVVFIGVYFGDINLIMFVIGVFMIGFLFWVCKGLKFLFLSFGFRLFVVDILIKVGFVVVVVVMILFFVLFFFGECGVWVVGDIFVGLLML